MKINRLQDIAPSLLEKGVKRKIAIASAEDNNTLGAIAKACKMGFVYAFLFGDERAIKEQMKHHHFLEGSYEIIHANSDVEAVQLAVSYTKTDKADVLMKGLVGTDKFLKAVLDKKGGLLPPKTTMSYVCALELPAYDKLLFITDTAVLPFPDLKQKSAMLRYALGMACKFGVEKPKAALISASEKVSEGVPSTIDYALLSKMAERGVFGDCVVDGPLDVFLACDPESVKIKGVPTPINGEADVLLFPTLEACNAFYKGLMLFGGGELAGLIQGTEKPVVVMSRSESELSKFYCIALACLMAE